ncbi:MAG TPA: hypothetical protein VH414_06060 [Lichenihabitans sp.]|jgi:LPS-assembly lipoprotein|nr:hypothetical protein [Lichenihabitans sp.]
MSSSKARPAMLRASLLGLMLLGLGGCLQPMYSSLGGNLGAELRAIKVEPVPDRLGHYLHDQLITNLNGTGESVAPKYRLVLTTHEYVQTALVDTTTQRPVSGTVITNVDWKLLPVDSERPIAAGTVTSSASYDRSEQRYANIAASHDAEIRDARTLADQLTTRVAAALARPPQGSSENDAGTNALSAAAPPHVTTNDSDVQ